MDKIKRKLREEETNEIIQRYKFFMGIPTLLNCPASNDLKTIDIALLGIPYGGGNSIETGQHLAPRSIRNTSMGYHRISRGTRINPFELCKICDVGDVPLPNSLNAAKTSKDIQKFLKSIYKAKCTPISIGGDHSITMPILRAYKENHPNKQIAMIHFDSHTDSSGGCGGVEENAGTGFKTAVEESIINPKISFQIGIRGPVGSLDQDIFSEKAGYQIITAEEFLSTPIDKVIARIRKTVGNAPIYISVDLDVLDPAYAPGVADPEIGGLTPMQLIKIIQGCRGLDVIGCDIVCFVPRKDANETTALAASEVLLELTGIAADSLHSHKRVKK